MTSGVQQYPWKYYFSTYMNIYTENKAGVVREFWWRNRWKIVANSCFNTRIRSDEIKLLKLLEGLEVLKQEEDAPEQRWNNRNRYSVKSLYR